MEEKTIKRLIYSYFKPWRKSSVMNLSKMERQYKGRFYSELRRRLTELGEPLLTEKQERAVYETVNIFQRWAFGGEEAGGQDERLSRPFEPEILLDLVESPPRRTTVVRFSNVVRGYAAEKRREERGLGHKGRLVTDRDALDMYCYAVQTSRVGRFEVVRGLGKVMKQLTERYVMVRGLIK